MSLFDADRFLKQQEKSEEKGMMPRRLSFELTFHQKYSRRWCVVARIYWIRLVPLCEFT
jgi:hypothetical protein